MIRFKLLPLEARTSGETGLRGQGRVVLSSEGAGAMLLCSSFSIASLGAILGSLTHNNLGENAGV